MPHPRKTGTRDSRLEFRLPRQQRNLIEQAAAVSGQNLTDYAVSSLLRVSCDVLEKDRATQLSVHDRDLFLRLLDEDARPNAALARAAKRYRKRAS